LAAEGGHLDVLRWLRAQDPPYPWDAHTCHAAARRGHLGVLRWLRAQDPPCPWSKLTCSAAATSGHLDVLRWLRAQDPPCPWDDDACFAAARAGNLDVLQWLRAQDPPCLWDEETCVAAARAGNLYVLRWLRAQSPPCPWDKAACMAASEDADVAAWIEGQASGDAAQRARLGSPGMPATRRQGRRFRPGARVRTSQCVSPTTHAPSHPTLSNRIEEVGCWARLRRRRGKGGPSGGRGVAQQRCWRSSCRECRGAALRAAWPPGRGRPETTRPPDASAKCAGQPVVR
jgi:hypothetical protein